MAIIRRGRIVYEGPLAALKERAGRAWRLRTTDPGRAQAIALTEGAEGLAAVDGELRFAAGEDAVAALTIALGRAGIGITGLRRESATLEDVFLELTERDEPSAEAAA